jgi:hypothetical protein
MAATSGRGRVSRAGEHLRRARLQRAEFSPHAPGERMGQAVVEDIGVRATTLFTTGARIGCL